MLLVGKHILESELQIFKLNGCSLHRSDSKEQAWERKNNEVKGSAVFNLQNVQCEVAHIL